MKLHLVDICIVYSSFDLMISSLFSLKGGSGYAKAIFFKQMTLKQSKNPILIDQHYCNGAANCSTKVKVSYIIIQLYIYIDLERERCLILLNCFF